MARLKEMNLYQRYRETDVHRTKPGTVVWKAMPFVLLIALLVGVWLYLSAQNRALEKELRQTDEAIASQTLLRDVSRARALETYLLELTGETERTEKLLTAIRSYPVVTSDVLRTLQECSRQIVRLDIRSFEAKTGILRFDAVTTSVADIPGYIRGLEDTNLFEQVLYSGYQYAEKEDVYYLQVECRLLQNNEEAGK